MLAPIADRVHLVRPGQPRGPQLRVLPILGPSQASVDYRLLDADTLPFVLVSEVREGSFAPHWVVSNPLDERLFLMDGQELIASRRSCVLDTDVLVPAATRVTLPMSCADQRRWGAADASVAGAAVAPAAPASPRSREQGDVYAHHREELATLRCTLGLPGEAVGVAIFHGRVFQGLDLFDRHSTLVYFWESLIDTYAIEWLSIATSGEREAESNGDGGEIERLATRDALDRAASAAWKPLTAPGDGEKWRLDDETFSGSALVFENSTLHLQLFPKAPPEPTDGAQQARRPRIRRRYGASGSAM